MRAAGGPSWRSPVRLTRRGTARHREFRVHGIGLQVGDEVLSPGIDLLRVLDFRVVQTPTEIGVRVFHAFAARLFGVGEEGGLGYRKDMLAVRGGSLPSGDAPVLGLVLSHDLPGFEGFAAEVDVLGTQRVQEGLLVFQQMGHRCVVLRKKG